MSVLEQVRSTMVGVLSNKKLLIFLVLAAIFIAAAVWVYQNYVVPRVDAAYVPNKEFIQKSDDGGGSHADLYFFFTTWCPHCKSAKPIWQSFQDKNKTVNGVTINYYAIDCDEDPKTAQQFGIAGYPTIKLKYGNQIAEYDAKPDPDTLKQFLETYIK